MERFTLGKTTFQISRKEVVGDDKPYMRDALIRNGKDSAIYYAAKVLKNGTTSKTHGGMFYRFIGSRNFVKAL